MKQAQENLKKNERKEDKTMQVRSRSNRQRDEQNTTGNNRRSVSTTG